VSLELCQKDYMEKVYRMLFLALFVLGLTTGFLYFVDTSEKDIPVACKYSLQSLILGYNASSESHAQSRSDSKKPDVWLWPYYLIFAAFLDSAVLVLWFLACAKKVGWTLIGPICCVDAILNRTNVPQLNNNIRLNRTILMTLLYVDLVLLFSPLVVVIGLAIRIACMVFDQHLQRAVDHVKETEGELSVIDREDNSPELVEGAFGVPVPNPRRYEAGPQQTVSPNFWQLAVIGVDLGQ
jgi:hypothetical protein